MNTYNGRQPPSICAELTGSTSCSAAGITATGHAPVLALCRQLLAAGLDADSAMEVYRGATLSLTVRSIGEGAQLIVKTAGNGTPIFALAGEGAGAPPIRNSEVVPADGWTDWPAATDGGHP